MSDIAIAMGSAFLTFVIGIMGVYVTFRPPTTEKAKLWWLASFAVCAVMGCGLVGWQTYRNGKQQESLTDSVGKIRDGLNQSETGRQVDNAYFKAKLEDAYKLNDQMRSFAPAMLKIAEANEDYTKRQFEQKSLTDKKLFDYTQNVVARIRDLGGKCKRREREILDARMQRLSTEQYKTVTPEQLQQAANERSQKMSEDYSANRESCAQQFRQSIQGDASYARRELMNRLGGDDFVLPRERVKASALDGIFAGPDPIDDAADYLEAFSSKLRERMIK